MSHASEFDDIAQHIFFPIYAVIADDALKETGVCSGRMLDLGCGGGHLGLHVLKATNMTGTFLDINPDAIDILEKRAAEWGVEQRVTALTGDVHSLTFADAAFDLIVSRGSFQFWKEPEKAYAEIYRVLAPGGRTYIGRGMGNGALMAEIVPKMKKRSPDWPACTQRNGNGYQMKDYERLLTDMRIPHRLIDDEEKGTWIVIEKA